MIHPEFWGWSTGALTIHLWGWENATDLYKRFARAPRLVHDARFPGVALEARHTCIAASVTIAPKSVCGSYPGVIVVNDHVPCVCCEEESAQSVSCCFTPKVQNNELVEKAVKWNAYIPSPVSAWPAAICDADQRPIPRISM
jgi:hypothetical protein